MLRVATFNVLFGHRRQGPGSWGERLPLLKRAIGATRADVLGLQEELSSTENKIAFARQAYNDSVMEYNTKRESFPDLVFAGAFGFTNRRDSKSTPGDRS